MDIGYILSTYVLLAILAFIMLGMGMTLTIKDFKNIALHPRSVAIGLSLQMLLLPLIAFLIAEISNMPPTSKVGFVLLAACSGGAISNLLNYIFKAHTNLALSISLTTINSFLIVFTLPTIVNLGLYFFIGDGKNIDLSFWDTLTEVLQMTVIPCIIGIVIRHFFPKIAKAVEKPLNYVMPILLIAGILATIYFKQSGIKVGLYDYLLILPYALTLNILGMVLGYYLPILLGVSPKKRLTISIEVGLQNTALAITVATSGHLLNDAKMAIPAIVYGLFSFFTTALWTVLVKGKRNNEVQ